MALSYSDLDASRQLIMQTPFDDPVPTEAEKRRLQAQSVGHRIFLALIGTCPPPWFVPLIRSARYLGTLPWVLAGYADSGPSVFWQVWALAMEEAEARAEHHLIEEQRRNNPQGV